MSDLFFDKLTEICHRLLFDNKEILDYVLNRGLTEETIKTYKIGAFPSDLRKLFDHVHPEELRTKNIVWNADTSPFKRYPVVIPIRDISGRAIAIGCRTLVEESKRKELGIPKYRNSNYSKASYLFGLDRAFNAIRESDQVFVVEGYFDAITAHQKGIYNIVAACGTAFSNRQLITLSRYTKNICLLFDNDEAGRLSSKQVMSKLVYKDGLNLECQFTPDGHKDLDEFLSKGGDFNIFLNKQRIAS